MVSVESPDAPPAQAFGRAVDDRHRLQYQFELLREDFLAWFDEALRRVGLSTDPDRADWSVLDMGCGEGQYIREVAHRYPKATVVGLDQNPVAIQYASAAGGRPNLRFVIHDARDPLPSGIAPDGGFDVVVSWLVLLHLPDKAAALRQLAAALRPGGALVLGNVTDDPVRLDHPAAAAFRAAGEEAIYRVGLLGIEKTLEPMLEQAGFVDIRTVELRYLVGGATAQGQRWYRHALATYAAGRPILVDALHVIDGAEYDRLLDALFETSPLDVSGETRFLVTVARRG
jgi:SAM-dependent methyltransferase